MERFTGFKTAKVRELPQAVVTMNPFHVVKLAGIAVEEARWQIQPETLDRPGRTEDPLYQARNSLLTDEQLLSAHGIEQLEVFLAVSGHQIVEVTWKMHQRLVAMYRVASPLLGKEVLMALIHDLSKTLPQELSEVRSLATTLQKRAPDLFRTKF